jgi:guanylate kinase
VSQLDSRPLLYVISGPSGSGKGTALDHIAASGAVARIPTFTTRPPRDTETDGVQYNFVDVDTFFALYEQGVIFEYTRTYSSDYYGSPTRLLASKEQQAFAVELDPMGFVRLRAASARRVVGIFVVTTTEDELRRRIIERGQAGEIGLRLKARVDQLTWAWSYDYVLLNDDRRQFVSDLDAVVRAETLKTAGARHMLAIRAEADPTLTGGHPPSAPSQE